MSNMKYRLVSRVIAVIDLALSVISIPLILFGYTLLFPRFSLKIVGHWLFFLVNLFITPPLTIGASWLLLRATNVNVDPKAAIKLSQLWWIWSWIQFILSAIIIIAGMYVMEDLYSGKTEDRRNWKSSQRKLRYMYQVIALTIQSFALFCIYKFREENKLALSEMLPKKVVPTACTEVENASKV